MGENNVFFLFSGMTFAGAIYGFVMIKETQGLTDKQKKELYTPKKYLDQKAEGSSFKNNFTASMVEKNDAYDLAENVNLIYLILIGLTHVF